MLYLTQTKLRDVHKDLTSCLEALKRKYQIKVRIPNLYQNGEGRKRYSISCLSLVYFYLHIGEIVTQNALWSFLRQYKCCILSQPTPRHFGMQYGLNFLVKNCVHPVTQHVLKAGEYCLLNLSEPHPSCGKHRSGRIAPRSFEELKRKYDGRCAVCGSKENEPHFKNKAMLTRLEKGHCNPTRQLTLSNCIPMCTLCNHVYQNKFTFNKRGYISRVTGPCPRTE